MEKMRNAKLFTSDLKWLLKLKEKDDDRNVATTLNKLLKNVKIKKK